jgi:hypothetical protein
MDIDLLRRGVADQAALVRLVEQCAAISDSSDGVIFEPTTISVLLAGVCRPMQFSLIISPIGFRHINFHGVYRFPLDRYLDRLMPSAMPQAIVVGG